MKSKLKYILPIEYDVENCFERVKSNEHGLIVVERTSLFSVTHRIFPGAYFLTHIKPFNSLAIKAILVLLTEYFFLYFLNRNMNVAIKIGIPNTNRNTHEREEKFMRTG